MTRCLININDSLFYLYLFLISTDASEIVQNLMLVFIKFIMMRYIDLLIFKLMTFFEFLLEPLLKNIPLSRSKWCNLTDSLEILYLFYTFIIFSDDKLYVGSVADFAGLEPLIYREPLRTSRYDLATLNGKIYFFL